MGPKAQRVLEAALALPEDERADVVGALLESLDGPADEGVEEAWADEIKRRIEDVESGAVKTIPWEEARKHLWQTLESRKRS
jgi:putative addiction module component (TIGR02574 family)